MARRLHIVAYDVSCPRRWRRLFGLLKRRGAHRQLSVFLVLADRDGVRRLAAEIAAIVDPTADRVLIAPLDQEAQTRLIEIGVVGSLPGPVIAVI